MYHIYDLYIQTLCSVPRGTYFLPTEVVEHCCSVTSLQLGETMPSISRDMDAMSYRIPLGVCAGVAPFNFPAMIPLWVSGGCCLFVAL